MRMQCCRLAGAGTCDPVRASDISDSSRLRRRATWTAAAARTIAGDKLQMLRVMRTHWKQNGGLAGLWWVLCGLKHYLCGGPFGPSRILLAGSINLCWVVFFWQGRLSSCCCCCRRSLTQLSNAFTELAFTIKMIRSHIYLLHQILRSFMTII